MSPLRTVGGWIRSGSRQVWSVCLQLDRAFSMSDKPAACKVFEQYRERAEVAY